LALRVRGRPSKAEVLAIQSGAPPPLPGAVATIPPPAPSDALTKAERRIAELERKIGRQQVELDFFQHALQVREARQRSGASGGTASTRSSKR
jgi:transposase